ncbi:MULTISPECIES: hypothetical protein [Gammaproteobacteria]|uniref:hypothetical protein n=1 Tax=Gammaproteobacteria TaxID=1236 RepID=UPI003A937EAE
MMDYYPEPNLQRVADELGITHDELIELDVEFLEDMGSSGEMVYGYYFVVPEHASPEILAKTGWSVGQTVEVSLNAFDSDEPEPDVL